MLNQKTEFDIYHCEIGKNQIEDVLHTMDNNKRLTVVPINSSIKLCTSQKIYQFINTRHNKEQINFNPCVSHYFLQLPNNHGFNEKFCVCFPIKKSKQKIR